MKEINGVDLNRALTTLYEKHNIGCAVMRGDFAGIRPSPHIYNTMDQVERAVSAVELSLGRTFVVRPLLTIIKRDSEHVSMNGKDLSITNACSC